MPHCVRLLLGLALALSSISALAEVKISDFAWIDRNHMEQQVKRIDDLARTRVGSQVRGDKTDLETLQRIIDRELIDSNDSLALQALGAVLGNVMISEIDKLEWKIYEDEKGRSRALCVENTQECLFPITMLSRRMAVGLKPDVQRIFNTSLDIIEPHLPEMPYGGSRDRRSER